MTTTSHEVSSDALSEKAVFSVFSTDRVIGDAFRRGDWWEEWMHKPLKNSISRHCNPGDVILDIGANMGSHSVALSKMAPENTIYSFEPQSHVCNLLANNVEANKAENVKIFCHALSAQEGESKFPKYDYTVDKVNQGGQWLNENNDGETVQLRVLDSVLKEHGSPRVCMIKMDVEGHENNVLDGARQMLSRDKPVMYFEDFKTHPESQITKELRTQDYLKGMGYCTVNLRGQDYFAYDC